MEKWKDISETPNSVVSQKTVEKLTLLTMKSERSCAALKSYSLYDLNNEINHESS